MSQLSHRSSAAPLPEHHRQLKQLDARRFTTFDQLHQQHQPLPYHPHFDQQGPSPGQKKQHLPYSPPPSATAAQSQFQGLSSSKNLQLPSDSCHPPPPLQSQQRTLHHSRSTPVISIPVSSLHSHAEHPPPPPPQPQPQQQQQQQQGLIQNQQASFPPRSHSLYAPPVVNTYANIIPSSPVSPTSTASPLTPASPGRRHFSHHFGLQNPNQPPQFITPNFQQGSYEPLLSQGQPYPPQHPPQPRNGQLLPREDSAVAVAPHQGPSWAIPPASKGTGIGARASSFLNSGVSSNPISSPLHTSTSASSVTTTRTPNNRDNSPRTAPLQLSTNISLPTFGFGPASGHPNLPTGAAAPHSAIFPPISAVERHSDSLRSESSSIPCANHPATFYCDTSPETSPDRSNNLRPTPQAPSLNDRSVSFFVNLSPLASGLGGINHLPPMPASAALVGSPAGREVGPSNTPRQSSMDSVISAISAKSKSGASDPVPAGPGDIDNLIQTAGSPEAVIRYLLKDKNSQSQQNSQLWRLVDKQRAMILGLNKDLERALKDKEKYRKKLKEVLASKDGKGPSSKHHYTEDSVDIPSISVRGNMAPDSPGMDSDHIRNSPVAMAPYPITPPADHMHNAPPTGVSEILDPEKAMPRPEEHAYDKFNIEAEELAAQRERRRADEAHDLHIQLGLPSSRGLPLPTITGPPAQPPSQPPPAPPSLGITYATPQPDQGLGQFPSPPRQTPPTPTPANNRRNTLDDDETDTDYEDILEVDEILSSKRGRRRTREEDDRERTKSVIKEMEARSRSIKEKQQAEMAQQSIIDGTPVPAMSPGNASPTGLSQRRTHVPASLDGMVQTSNASRSLAAAQYSVPLHSPGLPASPRPNGLAAGGLNPVRSQPTGSTLTVNQQPLSPRAPRQAIPLPPHTSIQGPVEAIATTTISAQTKRTADTVYVTPGRGTDSPTERRKIFKGFQTDEYPDLLLPPNALPSISIRVASSRMKPSRASLMSLTQLEEDPVFTLAIVSRSDGGELWRVEKDSMSLAKLDQRLKQFPQFTARTPDRSLFSGHSPAKLDARRIALDQYWEDVLNIPFDSATAVELCKYLSTHTLPPNFDENWQPAANGKAPTKEAAGGRALRSGYLTKKGKNFGGWKARYFVLGGPTLKYFETPGGAHLGTIKLQHAQIGKQAPQNESQPPGTSEDDNQYRHAFLIMEPKKKDSTTFFKHVLCAENDEERDEWVKALIQWVDYDENENKHSERPSTSVGEHSTTKPKSSSSESKPSKKKHQTKGSTTQQQPPAPHAQADSETLIGVSYDSTRQVNVPAHNPHNPHRNTMVGLPQNPRDQEPLAKENVPSISGPHNAHVISDTTPWGNRMSHMPPASSSMLSLDEKKQRKRSFFGFGPKARSSTDGQDSLFENNTNGSGYNGPVRQIFGVPLADAVRYNRPVDINVPLPCVIYRCIQYLDANGALSEEGIFRLSGSSVVIKALKERFNNEGDINLVTDDTYYDIHAIASLLKLYLRELPTTILTRDLYLEFLAAMEIPAMAERCAVLGELVNHLPQANATLLKYLIAFLIRIINNAAVNKMTVRNVGIVFSPTLNIPAPVFALFLQQYELIFGIDPEHYELPSPVSEDSSSVNSSRPSFDPMPPRPATASGASPASSSPHRQRLLEQTRNSPTPPLLQDLHSVRGTPTPPPAGQPYPVPGHMYEQGNGTHHGHGHGSGSGSGSASSGSEMMLGVPQEQSSNARRRESAIYGSFGSMQQSRLREETRF